MKIRDNIEYGGSSFLSQIRHNKSIFIVLSIVIIVFNMTYSLAMSVKASSESEITDNQNLCYIEGTSYSDAITTDTLNEIRAIEGVKSAFFHRLISCAIEIKADDDVKEGFMGYQVSAVPVDKRDIEAITGLQLVLGENDIIVNESYHDEGGLQTGTEVFLSYNYSYNEYTGTRKEVKVRIAGFYKQPVLNAWPDDVILVDSSLFDTMQSALYMLSASDIKEAQMDQTAIVIIADDVSNTNKVAGIMKERYETIRLNYALKAAEGLPVFAQAIFVVGGIIVISLIIMSVVVISSTMGNMLKNRLHEIGIIRAIGFKVADVRQLLIIEVTIIALSAVCISMGSFYLLMVLLNVILAKQDLFLLALEISGSQILWSTGITFFTMYIATFKIIGKTSKLNIVEVLRYE
ncbi:MAG: hypothetical protein FWF88_12470 [Peptococcaceae bacterium]|nr:hypothetical protein [Peptococcaceae bacterium]